MTELSTETLDAIARRYSCRAYRDEPVPQQTLRAIAEAGARAPSAVNRQPWRLVVVSDGAVVSELGASGLAALRVADEAGYARIASRGGELFYGAPAMIVVAAEPQPGLLAADLDVGIVASHLALAATSLGVNSCICGLGRLAFEGVEGEAWKRRLGFPAGFGCGITVLLGYAAAEGGTPHQPDFAKIIEVPAT
ncbi:MAG: nitroreductase family protein [Propionicimonas sp.]|nr:nitroreductase family protein [Propionicimonas sp.]